MSKKQEKKHTFQYQWGVNCQHIQTRWIGLSKAIFHLELVLMNLKYILDLCSNFEFQILKDIHKRFFCMWQTSPCGIQVILQGFLKFDFQGGSKWPNVAQPSVKPLLATLSRNRPDQVFCNRTGFSRIRNQYPVYRILPEPFFLGIFLQTGFEPNLFF